MRGYPIIFGEGVDPDAYQYFLRAGIASGTQTPTAYDNAASFNGSSQFLSVASNSSLTVTGTSFTFAFWANTPNATPNQIIISKRDAAGNAREYQISFNGGGIGFAVYPDGSFANAAAVSRAISSNSWTFYVCRYDSVAATIGISVNGDAFTSVGSVPALTISAANPLQFGANPGPALYYPGQLSSVGFWKRALTADEVTQLWNNGAGRTYASLDSGLRNNLISWWALNQNSVIADSHGTNTLTNNGTVTAPNIGPIVTGYGDSRRLISDFVRGIKSLGLWNQMVCWPLRSSQNAGSGTTAFSLGGLGQFDGTLASSGALPTWGADGITYDGVNDVITTTFTLAAANVFCGVVGDMPTSGSKGQYFAGVNGAASNRHIYFINPRSGFGGEYRYSDSNVVAADNATSGVQMWSSIGGIGLNTKGYRSTTILGTAVSVAVAPDPLSLSSGLLLGRGAGSYQGTAAMAFVIHAAPASPNTFYDLYKNTLGLGLGLP